jgi:MRG-binding protein
MIISVLGVNKYFQMACIYEKFRNSVNKDITSKVIWDHLDTMYDMQALVRLWDEFITQ